MTTDWKTLSQKLLLVYLVIQVVLHDALAYNLYQNDVQVFTGCSPSEDYLGDIYDCKKFYRCSNGWKITLHCPDGTVYDQAIRTCINSPYGLCYRFNQGFSNLYQNTNEYVNYNGATNYNHNDKGDGYAKSATAAITTCPYTFTQTEKLIFCSLTSFRQINPSCC